MPRTAKQKRTGTLLLFLVLASIALGAIVLFSVSPTGQPIRLAKTVSSSPPPAPSTLTTATGSPTILRSAVVGTGIICSDNDLTADGKGFNVAVAGAAQLIPAPDAPPVIKYEACLSASTVREYECKPPTGALWSLYEHDVACPAGKSCVAAACV